MILTWQIARKLFLMLMVLSAFNAASAQTVMVYQGPDWTNRERQEFYTRDQGSRIMPLVWMQALEYPRKKPFLRDSLARFGYLPNPANNLADIPVGFTVSQESVPSIGMTCAACHTRQINVNGTAYRIDGGPAIVDFQSFLQELDFAVAAVLKTDASVKVFARAVLGNDASPEAITALKTEVELWQLRFSTLIRRSLPDPAWGPSRLDAVSMIFNRLAGLDLGEPPSYIIEDNIESANAPTRYPFLWNAARQDFTQWPGFAENGNSILGLARNLGEVYGVFGVFHPTKQSGFLKLNRDYISNNSANFDGLADVEDLIRKFGPPRWPWMIDDTLASAGAQIYHRSQADGGCAECHRINPGKFRGIGIKTWATPILDVGTDRRECEILTRTAKSGVLEGAKIPFLNSGKPLQAVESVFNLLSFSVVGAITQHKLSTFSQSEGVLMSESVDSAEQFPDELKQLQGAFPEMHVSGTEVMMVTDGEPECAYESRVMEGIWAAAPYLHNGSVATLEDLLKPASQRKSEFAIGWSYDIEKVGLAAAQTQFDYVLHTTDCSDLSSGNSRCGHEFGTQLPESDKRALLEYLKSL